MMTEEDCLAAIENGATAEDLLEERLPGASKKFGRLCKSIEKYRAYVRTGFPDAIYYTANGGFTIMLGSTHNDKGYGQSQLVACSAINVSIQDGDF